MTLAAFENRGLLANNSILYAAYQNHTRTELPVRVAVLGAGAIGAYVGAALHRGGTEVHLVARGAHLEAIRSHGVQVLSPRGDFEARTPATDDPAEIGPVDYVFLGLKANSYVSAAPLLQPLLHDRT